jgi:hypothetical protein
VTVAGGNGYGAGANQLFGPSGVVVDAAGNIYVADPGNHRVQRVALEVPVISGADPLSVVAQPGRGQATVANPITVAGTPTGVITYNGGEWPAAFPVGTTTVTVEAINVVGTATATFTVTVTAQLPVTGADPRIVTLTGAGLLVASLCLRRLARRPPH